MKKLLPLLALQLVLSFFHDACAADTPARCSLLVVESQPESHVADPQVLVRYHMENGRLKDREVLATAANNATRYDLGSNRIYQGRYILTRWGDIFDLKDNTFLQQALIKGLDFVACEGTGIIFFRSNDREFYRYDLEKKELSKMDDPGKWGLLMKKQFLIHTPVLSPDDTKAATDVVFTQMPADPAGDGKPRTQMDLGSGKLVLYTSDGKTKILGTEFHSQLSLRSSSFPETPVFWLDSERILTQQANGKIVIVKMDGSVEQVVEIMIADQPVIPPRFSRDPAGRILYTCVDTYVIDVEKKKFAPFEWQKFDDGFELEVVKQPAAAKLRHAGEEIGFDSLKPDTARTFPGHLAIMTANVDPQSKPEIRVWCSTTKAWTSLEPAGHVLDIIGWVKDGEPAAPAAK